MRAQLSCLADQIETVALFPLVFSAHRSHQSYVLQGSRIFRVTNTDSTVSLCVQSVGSTCSTEFRAVSDTSLSIGRQTFQRVYRVNECMHERMMCVCVCVCVCRSAGSVLLATEKDAKVKKVKEKRVH